MNRLQEIEARLAELAVEIRSENSDLDAIEVEIKALKEERQAIKEERQAILDKAEKRKAMLDGIANLEGANVIAKFEDNKEEKRTMDNILAAPEYRSAYLKNLQRVELNETEKRTMTTALNSVGNAVPVQTQDEILRKVKEYAPLLNEITLLQVAGGVKFVVEGVVAEAGLHTEGATITTSDDTLVTVQLGGYEINKLVTISKSVATMSINTFEAWLTDILAEAIANKISSLLIASDGDGAPTGLAKITFDGTNSVTVAVDKTLVAKDVQTFVSLLNGGYDNGAKILMSKKTLFGDFMPLEDKSKNSLVVREGAKYFIYGYEVMLDDRVALHDAYLGNFKKAIVGNLAENVNVVSDFDINTNSFKFLGSAIFDSKVAFENAVVKLTKATV